MPVAAGKLLDLLAVAPESTQLCVARTVGTFAAGHPAAGTRWRVPALCRSRSGSRQIRRQRAEAAEMRQAGQARNIKSMEQDSYYLWSVTISVCAAAVSALAALANIYFQMRTARINSRPNLIIFARPRVGNIQIMELIVVNTGSGGARDITFKSHFSSEVQEDTLSASDMWIPGKNGILSIPFLTGNSQLSQPMGIGWRLMQAPKIWPLTVTVKYENAKGTEKLQGTFHIDPTVYMNFQQLGSPPDVRAAESLEKICDVLKSASDGSRGIRIQSVIETKSQHDQRHDEALERARSAYGKA